MKKIIYLFLILLLFTIGNLPQASASHMMSAEIGWTNVGQDSFMIKLKLYSDCNGVNASSGTISFFCATTGSLITSLSLAITTPVDVTPICNSSCTRCQSTSCSFPYGIRLYVLQGLVVLSGAGTCCQVRMTWEQTARSSNITTGASGANYYTEAIFNRCHNLVSSSPQFTNDPTKIVCVGQDFNWASGAHNNAAGTNDSVTYEWAEPLQAANSPVNYVGSYAYNKAIYFWGFPNDALPLPRGIHLDPQTGDIQFRPMKAEVTVMVVKLNVFRNNTKIAELRREMFIIVITCTNNNPPLVTTPNNVRSKSVCTGDSVSFDFSTSDPNPVDTVTISWNKAIPGAVWTHTNGLSKTPTAILTWNTTNADENALPYAFTVTAKDNACPVSGSFTQIYQISVKLKLQGNVMISDSGGGLYHFELDTAYNQNLIYLLNTAGKKDTLDGTKNYQFDTPGVYPYILKISYPNACNTISDTGIITVDTFLFAHLPADTAICTGSSITIDPRVFLSKGQVQYLWSNGDTNKILHTGPITNNKIITLTVKDTTGHTAKRSIKITMLKSPVMIPADTSICYGSTFSLEPRTSFAKGHITYNWSTGDTNRTLQTGRIYNATSISLTVKDSTGCTVDNNILINTIKYNSMLPDNVSNCKGSSINIKPNISFTKGYVNYSWSTGDTNPILHTGRLFKDSLITLNIEDSVGCIVQDYTYITMLRVPEISMDDKIVHCKKTITTITPYYQIFGSNNYARAFEWQKSGNQTIISNQNVLTIYDSGVYLFTVTDKFGCSDSDSVRINLFPPIDTSLQVNGSKLTAAPGMKKYVWYRNASFIGTGNVNIFIAPYIGWYFATLTDYFDCIDSTRSVFINPTGIYNQSISGLIRLYPNPTSGKLVLEAGDATKGDIFLSVFNMVGKEIINQTLQAKDIQTTNEIDITDQPAGIYTIIIRYQNTNFHQLIIKE